MELNVTVSVVVLLPVALALVAGGLILYRRSTQAGWRAAGMGSLALGVGTLLVFALTLPVSTEGEAPEPVIGAPIVSHGGPVKDYVSLVDDLRAAGATVDPAGTGSADFFAPQGQLLTVNGERVETFEFATAEEADAAAGGVSANGLSIVMTMADGTQKASMVDWVAPAHFYKAGRLIALYVGCDSDVIDVLQETMRPQFAGGAGPSRCHQTPPTSSIGQALEAADGSEVTVSGFLVGWGGITSLCSGLLESTRWTDSYITVTGIKSTNGFGFRELAEVRLSTGTESTSTSDQVSTPTPGQLSEWYREAQKVVWPIDGVYSSNIDERRNRCQGRCENVPAGRSKTVPLNAVEWASRFVGRWRAAPC